MGSVATQGHRINNSRPKCNSDSQFTLRLPRTITARATNSDYFSIVLMNLCLLFKHHIGKNWHAPKYLRMHYGATSLVHHKHETTSLVGLNNCHYLFLTDKLSNVQECTLASRHTLKF